MNACTLSNKATARWNSTQGTRTPRMPFVLALTAQTTKLMPSRDGSRNADGCGQLLVRRVAGWLLAGFAKNPFRLGSPTNEILRKLGRASLTVPTWMILPTDSSRFLALTDGWSIFAGFPALPTARLEKHGICARLSSEIMEGAWQVVCRPPRQARSGRLCST